MKVIGQSLRSRDKSICSDVERSRLSRKSENWKYTEKRATATDSAVSVDRLLSSSLHQHDRCDARL